MEKTKNYYKNTYHHVYNRGVGRHTIFFDDKDYLYFLKRTEFYKDKYQISVLGYCLMPNHFHLFVQQLTADFTIGKFIGDLTNSYTKATNKKYGRDGVLLQGPTKNKLIEDQNYFIWLIKYILMNPVKAKLVKRPEEWTYSCALDYFGLRNGTLTDKSIILSQFKSVSEFRSFIEDRADTFDYEVLF